MLKLIQAGAVAAVFLLGASASAAENSGETHGTTKMTTEQGRTARATTHEPGQTSGPAEGTNVKPTEGAGSAGEPGRPGLPGDKNGPAQMPTQQQQGK